MYPKVGEADVVEFSHRVLEDGYCDLHQTEGDATAAEGTLKALRPTLRTVPTPPSRVHTVVPTAPPTNRAFAGAQVKFTKRGLQSTLFWFCYKLQSEMESLRHSCCPLLWRDTCYVNCQYTLYISGQFHKQQWSFYWFIGYWYASSRPRQRICKSLDEYKKC